jgi:hypothetical protein
MWKTINSPIVIACIAIAALFIFRATVKPRLATEIRAAYEELNSIVKDGASDAEKSKAIQQFAQEIATQMRAGFSTGFSASSSQDNQRKEKDKLYAKTKEKLSISGVKTVPAEWKGHEKTIYMLKNNSNEAVRSLRINYEYYKNGELVDCRNDWVSEVKTLDPNQEIAISHDRTLPEDANECKADEVKIKITSFEVQQAD